jgi:hypothetical protein
LLVASAPAAIAILVAACSSTGTAPPGAVPASGADAGDAATALDARIPTEAGSGSAARAAFFVTTKIHKIELTVDAAEWAKFMAEHRNLDPNAVFTWHTGDVTLDGTKLPRSGFKAFGYGSREANPNKPNLRLDFKRNDPNQDNGGVEGLRAKNCGQDVTCLREPLTFDTMRASGLPVLRTTYADVFVNGEAFGFYMVSEHIGKDLVRDLTGNDDGAAYEAADCQGFVAPAKGCAALVDLYEQPFNTTQSNGADLAAICAAINGDAAQFVTTVGALVKLDEWILGVAADTAIAGDHDGFSTNGSNYRLYGDTKLKKMRLIMSGPDTTYDPGHFPDPLKPAPSSDCKKSNPAYRDLFLEKLTATPAGLDQYKSAVRSLRQGEMSPAKIAAKVDALWAIIGARVKADPKRAATPDPEVSKEDIKKYMNKRSADLAALGM